MPLIPRADAETIAKDAVVLNLGDLERRGAQLESAAKAKAQQIITDANAERERLIADAHETGFKQGREAGHAEGHAAGLEEGRAQSMADLTPALQAMSERWTQALESFVQQRDQMLTEARTDVVRLAVMIAQRVTKRVVDVDPGVVEAQMRDALSLLAARTTPRIAVNPADEPLARQAVPALLARFDKTEHIELVTDPELIRGSCVVRTSSGGKIDASITTQLDRVVADLLPDDPPIEHEQAQGVAEQPELGRLEPPTPESDGKEAA